MYLYLHINIHKYAAVSNGKCKSQRFSLNHYCLLIVQTEVCHLSVSLRRNKRKLPVCNGLNSLANLCMKLLLFYCNPVKGTVPRDFLPHLFFM